MEQKFKRGNKVKVLFGHPIWGNKEGVKDMCPNEVGQEALIVGSYADQYGGNDRGKYTIMFCETGNETSWKSENQLELIEEGGEHLFSEAKAKREAISKNDTDLNQIAKTWVEDAGNLSSETILFLFDKIGFKTSFLRNGEFFVLFRDWGRLYPFYNTLFTATTEYEIITLLHPEISGPDKEKIMSLFKEIQSARKQ